MNGKSMKMELDGNINIKDNVEVISQKKLKVIKQEFSNFMQINNI